MNLKLLPILVLTISILNSCKEFFEEDLESSTVTLLAPRDSVKTYNLEHTFKWEAVEGAEWYNLRIVSPSFMSVEQFVLDTNIEATSFTYSLFPGIFQWGVFAANYSSETDYYYFNLIIDTNKVFANSVVNLLLPSKQYTNAGKTIFQWGNLDDADKYRFEIRIDDWISGSLYYVKDTEEDTLSIELPENTYYWGIQASDHETNTSTGFSTRIVVVDQTAPNQPELLNPVNNDTITETSVTLNWKRGVNYGSPVFDSVFVSENISFTDLVVKTITNDTIYSAQLDEGKYYWRVRSFDKAGNSSDYSVYRLFEVIIE